MDALAYAVLAPNPHNMQPWRVRLEDEMSFSVFCDLDRLLPETDPPNRQITIGFGCFLELLRQAAAEKGYRADFSYFPDGEPQPILDHRPIARVTLVEDTTAPRDQLFGHILNRRTNRLEFDANRPLDEQSLSHIRAASVSSVDAFSSLDPAFVETLRDLAAQSWETEWSTPGPRRESIQVIRIGKSEINAQPNGLSVGGALPEALKTVGLLTRETLDDPESVAYKESLRSYDQACRTAMAFTWTTTKTNTRRDQLEAGRAWVRMQLEASAVGVAFHPLSQALQEYPEMSAHYIKAHELLAARPDDTVQMLARLGYAPNVPPTPREPLLSRLVST